MIEVMMALMLVALLAALAMPGFARGTGPAALRVTAFEVSALLREDRNAATRSSRAVATMFGADGIHSGASRRMVTIPAGSALTAPPRIIFMADGRASGGDIVIASGSARVTVAVSPDTGAIRVVAQ